MRHGAQLGTIHLCLIFASACNGDRVHPGFYGEFESDDTNALSAAPPNVPDAAGAPADVGEAGAGAPGPVTAKDGAPIDDAVDASDADVDAVGDVASSDAESPATSGTGDGACDLSGRWLATLHYVTDALGQQQTTHVWIYYEIERTVGGFEVTRGLHCGQETEAVGDLAVQASFMSSRAAGIDRITYAGQPVSSMAGADGCTVRFGKWYVVHGATTPHYTDPSIRLPTFDQPASGTTPGWEDWDADGQPGITSVISGTIAGKIFIAPRVWIALSGSAPDTASRLRLAVEWNQETNLLGFDGSPLLLTQGVRAADPELHFAELVRLSEDQAGADDHATCAALVELAPTLTPEASGI